jgi:hypothetical protein
MAIPECGKTERRREMVLIYIRMDKNMKGIGTKIKNWVTEHINIKMGMPISEDGETIIGMAME